MSPTTRALLGHVLFRPRKAKWTFLVFMAGDNNLSSAGDKDLYEMRMVGSTREVNIVVEFDNAGIKGSHRYRIGKDGKGEYHKKLPETDCGDPRALYDFVRWSVRRFPAEHYALVLWSHGSAWEPGEIDRIARSVESPQYSPNEAIQRSTSPLGKAFFRTSLEKIFQLNPAERAICVDDGSGHSLDTVELGRVLEQITTLLGQPLDILGMDACLMSNIEVAYQARPYAKYLVASEELEPGDGWPYDRVLARLTANPSMPAAELAGHIVQDYVQFYLDQRHIGDITQSALDLSRLDALTAPLDRLAEHLLADMPASGLHMRKAQRQSANFFYKTLWDINHFCEALGEFASPEVCDAAAAVRDALQPGMDRLVAHIAHNGQRVERCGGVSIYLPAQVDVSRYYAELEFTKNNRWPELLQAYMES